MNFAHRRPSRSVASRSANRALLAVNQSDPGTEQLFDQLESRQYLSGSLLAVSGLEALGISTTASQVTLASPMGDPTMLTGASGASPNSTASQNLMRLNALRADSRYASLDGRGFSTVIIDTGINLTHSFFGPDADHNGVDDRIVYQYDFADNDNSAADVNGHGSNVASIVASSDANTPGIAPAAGIIALKVFGNNGSASFASVERALQWVVANTARYNIASVNMSLGDNGAYTSRTSLYGIGDEMAALARQNVVVVAAAGNSFYSLGSRQGVSYPAADPNAIAVGAVYASNVGGFRYGDGAQATVSGPDIITPFSQRWSGMDIFAPGAPVLGAGASAGSTVTMHGTSQAAPQITGLAVIAQQLAMQTLGRRLTVAEFRSLLNSSGTTINDGDNEQDNVANTGLNFKRADAMGLANAIWAMGGSRTTPTPTPAPTPPPPPANRAPTLTTVANLAGAIAGRPASLSYSVLAQAANEADPDGDAVSFRVAQVFSGTLKTSTGALVVPNQTLLSAGQTLIWTPGPGTGVQRAFSVVAFDGRLASATPVAVNIRVDAAPLGSSATGATARLDASVSGLDGSIALDVGGGSDQPAESRPTMLVTAKVSWISAASPISLASIFGNRQSADALGSPVSFADSLFGGNNGVHSRAA